MLVKKVKPSDICNIRIISNILKYSNVSEKQNRLIRQINLINLNRIIEGFLFFIFLELVIGIKISQSIL